MKLLINKKIINIIKKFSTIINKKNFFLHIVFLDFKGLFDIIVRHVLSDGG